MNNFSLEIQQKIELINQLKHESQTTILAHYYTTPEVQAVADLLGDSLALSVAAQKVETPNILFAGVNFMAETAKVLSPEKRVLIPCPEAGCSLATSCPAADLAAFKAQHPDHLVVSYVNTSVEVKALTDICCTSSNALKVIESIPAEQPIIFAPDRNLGSYIARLTGRTNILLWDGACHVHEEFSLEGILDLRKAHPDALIVAHPECKAHIIAVADFAGSTAAILDFCGDENHQEYIVVTEAGILAEMQRKYPNKSFYPAPSIDSSCGCNNCNFMKMVTLDNIISTLQNQSPEVQIDETVRRAAEGAIIKMTQIK